MTTLGLPIALSNDVKSHPLAPTVQVVAATGTTAITIISNNTKATKRHLEKNESVFDIMLAYSIEMSRKGCIHPVAEDNFDLSAIILNGISDEIFSTMLYLVQKLNKIMQGSEARHWGVLQGNV